VLGIPPRVIKTPSRDAEHLNKIGDAASNMGTNSWIAINSDESIEFISMQAGQTGEIFTNLFTVSANEISKLIGGAVLGEDSKEGSRAKEQVALEITKSIQLADKTMIEGYINETLLGRLIALGYPFEGLTFEFVREKNLKEELEMALKIAQQFELDDAGIEYLNQTFSVPVLRQKTGVQTDNYPSQPSQPAAKAKNDFFS
jgi:phage gp29-like protein